MENETGKIIWVKRPGRETTQGIVPRSIFYCEGNRYEVRRVALTCEDATWLYAMDLVETEYHRFEGRCLTYDRATHRCLGGHHVACVFLDSGERSGLFLGVSAWRADDETELDWLIQARGVDRVISDQGNK